LEDLTGDDHDRDSAAFDRGPHGDAQDARQLIRAADQLGVDAALAEQLLGVGLLEVAGPDLRPRDVRREREHRNTAALGVEQAVDEVQVARSAARRADRQLAGGGGLTCGGERGRLFVAHVLPGHVRLAAQCVGQAVQRVARQPVDATDARGFQVAMTMSASVGRGAPERCGSASSVAGSELMTTAPGAGTAGGTPLLW
jgi:hypothetical protein